MRAKKHLSQNFLFDPLILSRIIDASGITPEETALEIGPGPGALTEMLLTHAARVIAVEFDPDMVARLRVIMATKDNFTLHEGDFMKFPLESIEGRFRVVANIPYHITTPIIFRLLEHRDRLISMTLTVQKELAKRAAAGPGSKAYGVLSLMLQYHGKVSNRFVIPSSAFRPSPKVDSACLHLEVTERPTVQVADEETFKVVVRGAFTHRRKTLGNSLKKSMGAASSDAIAEAGLNPKLRAEMLSIEEYAALSDVFFKMSA